jgi:hypothetical protein
MLSAQLHDKRGRTETPTLASKPIDIHIFTVEQSHRLSSKTLAPACEQLTWQVDGYDGIQIWIVGFKLKRKGSLPQRKFLLNFPMFSPQVSWLVTLLPPQQESQALGLVWRAIDHESQQNSTLSVALRKSPQEGSKLRTLSLSSHQNNSHQSHRETVRFQHDHEWSRLRESR